MFDRSRWPWCEIDIAHLLHTCFEQSQWIQRCRGCTHRISFTWSRYLVNDNTFIHVVAMGNLLSHWCVPAGCLHVFVLRCLQMAPVRQSREYGVPRFLANRLSGQSSDLSLTNGQCDSVILSHSFEINICYDPQSAQIAGQQGTGWSMDFTWMWKSKIGIMRCTRTDRTGAIACILRGQAPFIFAAFCSKSPHNYTPSFPRCLVVATGCPVCHEEGS